MSKSLTIRLSDRDLYYLDFLHGRYYGSDLQAYCKKEDIKLPLSPVIRASVFFAFVVLSHYPDINLSDPVFPSDFALPDGSGAAGSSR